MYVIANRRMKNTTVTGLEYHSNFLTLVVCVDSPVTGISPIRNRREGQFFFWLSSIKIHKEDDDDKANVAPRIIRNCTQDVPDVWDRPRHTTSGLFPDETHGTSSRLVVDRDRLDLHADAVLRIA